MSDKPVSRELSSFEGLDLGPPEQFEPLFPAGTQPSLEAWQACRTALLKQWHDVLGAPSFGAFERRAVILEEFEGPGFHGTVFSQPTGPDQQQQLLLMTPLEAPITPRPAAIVPFYHPDLMAGWDLAEKEPRSERPLVRFGHHLVQQGYTVVCSEAFPYNTVPEPDSSVGFAWWQAATDKLLGDNPNWSGIGKLTWDTARAVDLLLSQPDVDPRKVVAIGHSLGGKMAFYAGAFDERIKAVIASDFGIGWNYTNWDAPWYLGARIHDPDFRLAHHQLLALLAPRSCLVIAGEADRAATRQYVLQARPISELYGCKDTAGVFHHGTGHQPTEESIVAAYRWLAEQLELPEMPWEF